MFPNFRQLIRTKTTLKTGTSLKQGDLEQRHHLEPPGPKCIISSPQGLGG